MSTPPTFARKRGRLLPVGDWPFWLGPLAWLLVIGVMLLHSAVGRLHGGLVVLQFAAYIAIAIGLPWLWSLWRKPAGGVQADDWGLQWQPVWRWLAAALVLAAALYVLNTGGQGLPPVPPEMGLQVKSSMGLGKSVLNDVLMVLAITALAPLAEELLFRGLIYRSLRDGLRRWLPLPVTMVLAWLLATGAFVYTHSGSAPAPQLALMATLFTLAFEAGRSLWGAVLLHALNNTFTLWLGLSGLLAIPSSVGVFAAPWILGLALAGPLMALALTAALRALLQRGGGRRASQLQPMPD